MKIDPITISPKTTCTDAFRLMHEKLIDKLTVLAEEGNLVGIVTYKDLLYALPSSAAELKISQIDGLFAESTVARVMTRRIISVSEDCLLEEAARIMVDNKIGSLPVMRGHRLVGMITRDEIFHAMMEALGGQTEGWRITIRLHKDTGELGAITDGIVRSGGKLISLSTFWGDAPFHQAVTLKVQGVNPEELMSLLEKDIGVQVIDHRQSRMECQPELASSLVHAATFPIQALDAQFTQSMALR